jgi:prepilin-type processing-associated H-X9-DG protein/prepilin-type N-terminal cleavage/methylation domain-containing protein
MPHRTHARARAFTLVELLVVIGIIAVLISVLLPALTRARERGQAIACQSNLRQIVIAAFNYAADNKGSLPYGFIFNKQRPVGSAAPGRPADGGSSGIITWYNVVDMYMSRGTGPIHLLDGTHQGPNYIDGSSKRKFNAALRCPSVPPVFNEKIHYYQHGVAMPHMPLEYNPYKAPVGQQPVHAPAKLSQLYPDNALFWDTALWYEAEPDVPSLFWQPDGITGYNLPCTSIDYYDSDNPPRGLYFPNAPELRYRGPGADRLAQSSDPMRNPNGPIAWLSDEFLQANGSPAGDTANTDPAELSMYYCAFGGPRWRHQGNSTANVAFADGSVRGLKLNTKRIVQQIFYDNEFRRHMIMMKWPSDKKDAGVVQVN